MTSFTNILSPDAVLCIDESVSKKKALEMLAALLSKNDPELDTDELFSNLTSREKLGSTAIGEGIAIPHCRSAECRFPIIALMLCKEGIDYEAVDNRAVDILCALAVPEEENQEHLNLLAKLAELFGDAMFRQRCRRCENEAELFSLFTQSTGESQTTVDLLQHANNNSAEQGSEPKPQQ